MLNRLRVIEEVVLRIRVRVSMMVLPSINSDVCLTQVWVGLDIHVAKALGCWREVGGR